MIEWFIAGIVVGFFSAFLFFMFDLQKYKKRVEYLQDTLNMCNDQDD